MAASSGASTEKVAPPPDGAPWTILHMVRWAGEYLCGHGVQSGRLDAELMLGDTLGMSRLDLYLHFDRPLDPAELDAFRPRLLARAGRKPLQYVLGHTAFRQIDLHTDPRVLIPRPETEELVGAVLERTRRWGREDLSALDVGTGSGAIAISLAVEGPFTRIVATDSSDHALVVARENASAAGVDGTIELRAGSGLGPVAPGERFDVLVSNPPYVTAGEFEGLEPEVRDWEPQDALVALDEGMAVLRELIEGAASAVSQGGLLAFEVGAGQAAKVVDAILRTSSFENVEILKDLTGRDRIVVSTRKD